MAKTTGSSNKIITAFHTFSPLQSREIILIMALVALISATFLGVQSQAEINSGTTVMLIADGEKVLLNTESAAVADVLAEAGIILGEFDRVEPALDEPLKERMNIRVTRVESFVVTEEVKDPYKTTVISNSELRPGMILKVNEGRNGVLRKTSRVWKKDGVETHRKTVSSEVIKYRVDSIEVRGGAAARSGFGQASLPSRSSAPRKVMTMVATAYDPGPISCGKYADGYTSIGMKAGKGVVAIDPRVIPYRTKLYIEGYGYAIAGDCGGAIKGNRIDLGFDTYREAIRFGRKTVKVFILD